MLKFKIRKFLSLAGVVQGDFLSEAAATSMTRTELIKENTEERPLGFVIDLAEGLMRAHGLIDWRLTLDNARRRAGQCDFSKKTISLSRLYISHADLQHIRDTILHEIAHALVGPSHGHNAIWQKKAREIGCSGSRCHTMSFARERWIMKCPNGCFEIKRHRRKSGLICASCKAAVFYSCNNLPQ